MDSIAVSFPAFARNDRGRLVAEAALFWAKRTQHGLRFLGDDGEQHAGSSIRAAAALLPGMDRGHVETEGAREIRLR